MNYATTNIRIETGTLKELKLRAVEEGRRVAELIREAIGEYLRKTREKVISHSSKKDPIFSIIGICKTGVKDGSERHDEFVYRKGQR